MRAISKTSRRFSLRSAVPSRPRRPSDLRGYLGDLAERGFKPASVARRLSAIRQLYRFLYAENHRRDDPAAILEGPKRGRSLPKVLGVGEVDRLIAAARAAAAEGEPRERLRGQRLYCLLELLYATGLRISELVSLPASAARRNERMLIVRGKGGKERVVPLNEAARTRDARLRGDARRGAGTGSRPSGCFPRSAKPAT